MVIVVTGASSGIGLACAKRLVTGENRVYGASRNVATISESSFQKLTIDVCDPASVSRGIDEIVRTESRIDAIVCAAGFGIAGPIEATSLEEARRQFETNFFGVVNTVNAVLPIMRQQRKGHVVVIGSIGGLSAIPFQAFYSASKFALEGYVEALRMEVRPFGIRAVIVEPGDFKTAFTKNRIHAAAMTDESPYASAFEQALRVMEHDEQNGPDPVRVAMLVERILADANPRLRYTVGPAPQRLAVVLKRLLPYSLYERMIRTYYKLD
jgi:short-subunit dehydrogenase